MNMLLIGLLVAAQAQPVPTLVPRDPVAYDPLTLQFSCRNGASGDLVDESRTEVRMVGSAIRVDIRYFAGSIPPGMSECLTSAGLGSLPAGEYSVDVYADEVFYTNKRFQVAPMPPASTGSVRPRTNFSGIYWLPQKPGRALDVAQDTRTHALLAIWYTYDQAQRATFFAFQCGQWTSPDECSGSFYRTTGEYFATASIPSTFFINPVGTGTFDCPDINACRIRGSIDGIPVNEGFVRFYYEGIQ